MRFLIDECVSLKVHRWLRVQGYDSLAIAEIAPSVRDIDVLALAQKEKRILITMDKDFGELIFRDSAAHSGVVLLRLHDWKAATKISIISNLLAKHKSDITDNFIVATEQNIRITRC
ncbi:MAG TPA: DUF5615 family PIN-like protein [Candidatus Babeliales bacterium]|nr:DUF5615 family PIN-like protein [Candidatus Babeliales bacterium]